MARREGAKDREIRELNDRIQDLEMERVIVHHVQEMLKTTPVQRIQMDQNLKETDKINEMKTYLGGVMAAKTSFEKNHRHDQASV